MIESVKYSVIVPCYNEAGGISSTIERLMAALSKVKAFEVIVVDDGSDDGTGQVIESLRTRYPTLSIIRHNRNRGYGAALKSGIRESTGELILIIDADGTYPPEEATTLIDMLEDADMVVGARTGSDVSERGSTSPQNLPREVRAVTTDHTVTSNFLITPRTGSR